MNNRQYRNILKKSALVDYGPAHGSIVIMPYGLRIWGQIVSGLSKILEESGHDQICFPLLFPEKFLDDETEYISGISPKGVTVTKAGGNILNEPLVIRPTSELLACHMFSKWVNSFRDLPIKVYQWGNIVRCENHTLPFIKGTEIQWLEGHTIHATHEDALQEIDEITKIFQEFITNVLKIPIVMGQEPDTRKFVGSLFTRTFEAMTPNGRALQLAAVYDLGKNFTEHFKVQFRDIDNFEKICWMTDWGLGFRLIGALVLLHSDDRGMRLPSMVAPYQAIILQLSSRSGKQQLIDEQCTEIKALLEKQDIRVKMDVQGNRMFKQTVQYWEQKGVPVIILVGDLEIDSGKIAVLRRDKKCEANKLFLSQHQLAVVIKKVLCEIDETLFKNALHDYERKNIVTDSLEILNKKIATHWITAPWCGTRECERSFVQNGKNIQLFLSDSTFLDQHKTCIICGRPARYKAIFAKKF